jgi:uncharacterized ferritin-like protein (DUF455 family)
MQTLRQQALLLLLTTDLDAKITGTLQLDLGLEVGASAFIAPLPGIPGRPDKPELVPHTEVKSRSIKTTHGHAALLHSLAHIELNAVDLALDLVFRFEGMPDAFYLEWLKIAKEEATHFSLLRSHLCGLGFDYGSFPAHNSLWAMAEKTKDDILARIALVPRTLEARGLDASPQVKAKLVSINDHRGADILDVILRDEIGHVYVGNKWFAFLCGQRELAPITTYRELAQRYTAPRLRGPFNIEARKAAGFTEDELLALVSDHA